MTRSILALAFLLTAGTLFFMYTRPVYDAIRINQAQIAQYDQALEKAAQLQQIKQSLLARYNAFNPKDIERLQILLPDHVDNIGLILDLNNLAASHAMALENVDVTDSNATAANAASATIGATPQQYESLTLRFTTHSTYANFEQFLKELEASLRIVDLESLTITNGGSAGAASNSVYQYQIILRTYWLK